MVACEEYVYDLVDLIANDSEFRNILKEAVLKVMQGSLKILMPKDTLEFQVDDPPIDVKTFVRERYPTGKPLKPWSMTSKDGSIIGTGEPENITIQTFVLSGVTHLVHVNSVITVPDLVYLCRIGKKYQAQYESKPLTLLALCHFVEPHADRLKTKFKVSCLIV